MLGGIPCQKQITSDSRVLKLTTHSNIANKQRNLDLQTHKPPWNLMGKDKKFTIQSREREINTSVKVKGQHPTPHK